MEGMMTMPEADRLAVMRELSAGTMRQHDAARRLGLGVRQGEAAAAPVPGVGGGGSGIAQARRPVEPEAAPAALRTEALALVGERYADFGPTLAAETLTERHGIEVGRETLRRWMIEDGLWQGKSSRRIRVHQRRARRARLGSQCRSTVRRTTCSRGARSAAR